MTCVGKDKIEHFEELRRGESSMTIMGFYFQFYFFLSCFLFSWSPSFLSSSSFWWSQKPSLFIAIFSRFPLFFVNIISLTAKWLFCVRTVCTVHQVAQVARVDTSAAFFSSSLSFSSWGEWQCKLNWSLIDLLGLSSDDDHWLAMVS